MIAKLTFKSSNQKTGPIPVSMTESKSCPPTCPLIGSKCYGGLGPLNWQWRKVKGSWEVFLKDVRSLPDGQIWRHNQVGDLPGVGPRVNAIALKQLVSANKGKKGFTYTHKPVMRGEASPVTIKRNRAAIQHANKNGFTINLSADNLREADQLASLKIAPVVVILPSDQLTNTNTPDGRKVVVCPFSTRGIQCKDCGLCQKQRSVIIGFPAHGTMKKQVSEIARG